MYRASYGSPACSDPSTFWHDSNQDFKHQQGLGMVTHSTPSMQESFQTTYDPRFDSNFEKWTAASPYRFNHEDRFGQQEQFSAYLHDSISRDFAYGSMHINPAMLEGSALNLEDHPYFCADLLMPPQEQQLLAPAPKKKQSGTRSAGKPTNIVPNSKMDRKTLKRLRNRVSASRCRIKKKVWISAMEKEAQDLVVENEALEKEARELEVQLVRARQIAEQIRSGQKPTVAQEQYPAGLGIIFSD